MTSVTTFIINDENDLFIKLKELEKTTTNYVIGFDIEYIDSSNYPLSFGKSHEWTYSKTDNIVPCTIQIANESICLIINLVELLKNKTEKLLPTKLVKLIINEKWTKVGVGIDNDIKYLANSYNLSHCSSVIDLKNIAILAKLPVQSLDTLCSIFIGYYKKDTSFHDWSKKLTKDKIEYIALDAIISYRLYKEMFNNTLQFIEHTYKENSLSNIYTINIKNYQLCDSSTSYNSSTSHSSSNLLQYPTELFSDIRTLHLNTTFPVQSKNYISLINEDQQKSKGTKLIPVYDIKSIDGIFISTCLYDNISGKGSGTTKQEAKMNSAKQVWLIMNQ